MITKEEIIAFEQDIAGVFATGVIRAPVHLRAGREDALIDVFKTHQINDDDYIFGFWDSHELALLKGVPKEELKQAILEGKSISLCFPKYKVMCSGIVGSLMGTAAGVAWSLKQQGSKGRAFLFCGDMSAETGIFHEAVKYVTNFDLPAHFIVCDNGVSVMTNTRETWGDADPWFTNSKYAKKITYFKYTNGYPHSGLGKLIKF